MDGYGEGDEMGLVDRINGKKKNDVVVVER